MILTNLIYAIIDNKFFVTSLKIDEKFLRYMLMIDKCKSFMSK